MDHNQEPSESMHNEETPEETLVERLQREAAHFQNASPFFNGLIPPEVRNRIFDYALTEDETTPYDKNAHYFRPDQHSRLSIHTALLQTCRRIYLEAYHLPLLNRTHLFWHERAPPNTTYRDEASYLSRFSPSQLALVRDVHLYTQQYWLEGSFQAVCQLPSMQCVEKMTITLRRGDWFFWETGNVLGINPQRGQPNAQIMKADWKREAAGQVVPWELSAWGVAFGHLRALRTLEFEFETTVYQEEQLQAIVRHARNWRFPMGEGRVLSAEGQEVRRSVWRGPKCVWSKRCEGCRSYARTVECLLCRERKEAMEKETGPMLVILKLRWLLAPVSTPCCS